MADNSIATARRTSRSTRSSFTVQLQFQSTMNTETMSEYLRNLLLNKSAYR